MEAKVGIGNGIGTAQQRHAASQAAAEATKYYYDAHGKKIEYPPTPSFFQFGDTLFNGVDFLKPKKTK